MTIEAIEFFEHLISTHLVDRKRVVADVGDPDKLGIDAMRSVCLAIIDGRYGGIVGGNPHQAHPLQRIKIKLFAQKMWGDDYHSRLDAKIDEMCPGQHLGSLTRRRAAGVLVALSIDTTESAT